MTSLCFRIIGFLLLIPIALAAQQKSEREVPPFKKISIGSGINAFLHLADQSRVVLEGEPQILQKAICVVEGDQLILQMKGSFTWRSSSALNAHIYFTELDGISATSGSDIRCEDRILAPMLELQAQSGSEIWLMVAVQQLKVLSTSGSDIKLSGEAMQTKVKITSGSTFIAPKLQTKTCTIEASGGANAKVWITAELSALAESGSTIEFLGNPPIKNITANSGGSVDAR